MNLIGAYNTVRAALPAVTERSGYVAVTASLATFAHPPGMSAYAATKSGVEAFCNSLRMEVAHLGVDVATIHPAWIATRWWRRRTPSSMPSASLRASLAFPLSKTYPVERAARDIARGFERRSRRICTPSWVRGVHAARAALTTRLAERDFRRVAPEIDRVFAEEVAREGAERASASERVRDQVPGAPTA